MSVSVSEKIALGGYPMQTTVRCLLLQGFWLTAKFARMYLKWRVMRMAKFISKSQMEELEDACTFGVEEAHDLLRKYTGIEEGLVMVQQRSKAESAARHPVV